MIAFNRSFAPTDFIKTKFKDLMGNPNSEHAIPSVASLAFIILAGLIALALQTRGKTANPARSRPELPTTFDHSIPEGHSLLPVQITNYESLDSIVGTFSIVDLYTSPVSPREKSVKIAKRVKLLKASNTSNHFAILIPNAMAAAVISTPGPYRVTIRSPDFSTGTKLVKRKSKRSLQRVHYITE